MGALVTVPIILSCGVVAYHSIGPAYVSAGITAAFISAIVAAVLAGLLGGPPLHVNTPKTSHAAILSSLIAVIATHHSFSDHFAGEAAAQALMVICWIALFISGLFQTVLGALRLGGLVKFVPYPVLAGIINGFALQIIIGQVPYVLGIEHLPRLEAVFTRGSWPIHGWSIALSSLAGGLVLFGDRLSKRIPSALTGLVVGTLAYALLGRQVDSGALGPVIGEFPAGIAVHLQVADMLGFLSSTAFQRHIFPIVATGITLALISSIQSLLSMSASDELFETRHDSNKELMIQGSVNMVAATLGGTPSGGSPNVTRLVHANGGRDRWANIALALALIGISFGSGHLIGHIPLSVMAGVVIVSTASSMDRWTQQLLRKIGTSSSAAKRSDALMNLVVVSLVAALVIFEGALAALGVGIAAIFFLFVYRANSTVIGRVMHADQITSRTAWPMSALRFMAEQSNRIAVLELQGPLFFGNSETVYQRIEKEAVSAKWIILSFKHCPTIDTSGAMLLKQLAALMHKQGRRLLLSDLPQGGHRREYLQNIGADQLEKDGLVFDDLDSALAFAESELLQRVGLADTSETEKDLTQFEVLAGLTEKELLTLRASLEQQHFDIGDCIIQDGNQSPSLYFLTRGKVSVYTRTEGRLVRLTSYSAGVDAVFGEASLAMQGTRSMEVCTDTAATVLRLPPAAYHKLCAEHPTIALRLMQGVSTELSLRLTRMMYTVRELEAR